MTRRTITLLIIITVIIGVIAFVTLNKEASIENVILTDDYSTEKSEAEIIENESAEFNSSSNIYAVILLKNITIDDSINICWKKIEKSQETLIQEDIIIEKQKGSGHLVVSMIKKNDKHENGNYKLYVKLNDSGAIEKPFTIR